MEIKNLYEVSGFTFSDKKQAEYFINLVEGKDFNEDLLKNHTSLDTLFRESYSFVIVKFDDKNGVIYYQEIDKKQALFLLNTKTKEKRAEIREEQKNRNLNNAINIFAKLSEEEQKELLVKLLLNKNEVSK